MKIWPEAAAGVDDLPQGRPSVVCLGAVLLVFVTLTRVTLNIFTVLSPASHSKFLYGDLPISVRWADAFARPAVGAASLVPFFWRYNKESCMHYFSLVGCWAVMLAASGLELVMFLFVQNPGSASTSAQGLSTPLEFDGPLMGFCWFTRIAQTFVTYSKLQLLGWPTTASRVSFGWVCWVLLYLIRLPLKYSMSLTSLMESPVVAGLFVGSLGLMTAVRVSILLYEASVKHNMLSRKAKDRHLRSKAASLACLLRLGAFLLLLDAIYLPVVEFFGHEIGVSPALFLTLDNSLVLASILVLGGLVGPTEILEQEEVLQELAHMAFTQGKRITFPGRVNPNSQHCIVSFPGWYADVPWSKDPVNRV